MKKMLIYSFLMVCSGLMASCDGDTYTMHDKAAPNATITTQTERIDMGAEGGSTTFSVNTTGKEWGAISDASWVVINTEGTTSQQGTVKVTLDANPQSKIRTANITVMSGTARKIIALQQAAAESDTYNAPEGYSLVWHDEFDSGTELNGTDWTHEVQGSGWVNNELQNYVNHVTPGGEAVTEVKNGKLLIHCVKEDGKIYSGRVYAHVKEGWKYGYIEASIKLPKGKGTWPAFWMMPVNFTSWPADGEIDIMEEVGGHANYVSSSLHANAHVHSNGTQVTHEMLCEGAEDGFHTYAIKWTGDNITTYVDGNEQLSYDNRGLGRDDWPYDDPFYVILNLAWGGSWGGMYGIDESALPATMEVDYVRVFQK